MQLNNTVVSQEFLEKFNRIDFGPIGFKLMHPDGQNGWTLEEATAAIEQYRCFLLLVYLYPDRMIVPSRAVDQVWHEHILDTQKYQEDCLEVFGHLLHHYPYLGMLDQQDQQAAEAAFADTCQLLDRHFN